MGGEGEAGAEDARRVPARLERAEVWQPVGEGGLDPGLALVGQERGVLASGGVRPQPFPARPHPGTVPLGRRVLPRPLRDQPQLEADLAGAHGGCARVDPARGAAIIQPFTRENGEVIDPTAATTSAMTASLSRGTRWERQ